MNRQEEEWVAEDGGNCGQREKHEQVWDRASHVRGTARSPRTQGLRLLEAVRAPLSPRSCPGREALDMEKEKAYSGPGTSPH